MRNAAEAWQQTFEQRKGALAGFPSFAHRIFLPFVLYPAVVEAASLWKDNKSQLGQNNGRLGARRA